MLLRHLLLAGLWLPLTLSAAEPTEETPPLSVRSLFHPDERFDYFSSSPPATQWLGDSRLAIRRKDDWQVMDPASGNAEPWELPSLIRAELEKVEGFSSEAVRNAVRSAAQQTTSLDRPILQRVGSGLVVIGGGAEPRLLTRDAASWEMPELSPDGSAVAFVREQDLYVVDVESGEILRLTQDGSDTRLNGKLDWTYQEEIYGRGNFKGFWWSPDSRQIALLRIDIGEVLPFTVTESDTPRGGTQVVRYPKAGDAIPRAGLWVAALDSMQLTPIHQPVGDEAESLVVRVTWRPHGGRLSYQIQNRVQTWLELREADTSGTDRRVLLREQGPAWIEILGEPHWLPGGDFLWLSDLPAGRRHLWKVSKDGSRRRPLTSGDWNVREVVHIVAENAEAFITGDQQRGVRGQQLYRVRWGGDASGDHDDTARRDGEAAGPAAAGNVAPLTSEPGWHAVEVSPDGRWFTDTFSTLTTEPRKSVVAVTGDTRRPLAAVPDGDSGEGSGDDSDDPDDSDKLSGGTPGENASEGSAGNGPAPWHSLELSQPQWVEITTDDGLPLPAYLIPPHGVDLESSSERHPVLIYTYGGPLAPAAVDRWSGRNYLYHQLLASRGIGVLVVDNRSSGGRGIADTWSVYRQMGVQELADLLEAVEWLKGQAWVDPERLAMRGWSFGGYYTAYALTHSDAFAAGIAGGSVTDWRNYDAFYTERYMGLPQENAAGYQKTSVTEKAADLHGRLLLIHGEVDDNVHLGNTLQLVAALQQAGKSFDMMIYPGAAHGVSEPRQTYHLYKLMTEFLVDQLGVETTAE